jgi:hypothetical protein
MSRNGIRGSMRSALLWVFRFTLITCGEKLEVMVQVTAMKRIFLLSIAIMCCPTSLAAPYKHPFNEQHWATQPVVYARADAHGFGVQYLRSNKTSQLMGIAGGPMAQLFGMAAEDAVRHVPTKEAKEHAEMLVPVFEIEAIQDRLEEALAAKLSALPMFRSPIVVKRLPEDAASNGSAFEEDPVLVVELFASLTPDYRALQVSSFAYVVSGSHERMHPYTEHAGRLYVNRFDYVSDLLPVPLAKSEAEILADTAAVEAKYGKNLGKLTDQQKLQRKQELRIAEDELTAEERRAPLLQAWIANSGAHLKAELARGTDAVAEMLASDIVDSKPTRKPKRREYREHVRMLDTREITRTLVGGYAGALLSYPIILQSLGCSGSAYSTALSAHPVRRICDLEKPGTLCGANQVNTPTGCQDILRRKKKT